MATILQKGGGTVPNVLIFSKATLESDDLSFAPMGTIIGFDFNSGYATIEKSSGATVDGVVLYTPTERRIVITYPT
jgi:hypothetical protein